MVKQVPDANPLKPLLKQIEHLAAYATTYRYATTSGNIKPSPDDKTLKADMASVNAALSAAATAFGVDLSKQDQPAGTASAPRGGLDVALGRASGGGVGTSEACSPDVGGVLARREPG